MADPSRPARPPRRPPADALLPALVGAALFSVYLAAQRGVIASVDGNVMVAVARSMLEDGSFAVPPEADPFGLHVPYTSYGIGVSLLVLPFMAVQLAVDPAGQQWVTLANPVVLAAGGAVLVRIGSLVGWRPVVAVITALAAGTLTMAVHHSTEAFAEPGVALAQLIAVLGLLHWVEDGAARPVRAALLMGVGVGVATLFRTDSILLVGLIVPLALLFTGRDPAGGGHAPRPAGWRSVPRPGWPAVLAVVVPVAAAGVWLLVYNDIRFGSPWRTGFEAQSRGGAGFTKGIGEGLRVLLVSPSHGFFWFNPVLLLGLAGLPILARRHRALAVAVAVLVVARVIFYSRWFDPGGGIGWGPRFLLPIVALLAIPAGALLEHAWSMAGRRRIALLGSMAGLAAVSAAVTVLSVWVPYEQWVNEWVRPPGAPPAVVAERLDRFRHDLAAGHVAGNVRLADEARPFPLRHFDGGPQPIGIVAVVGAVAAAGGAVAVARRAVGTVPPS